MKIFTIRDDAAGYFLPPFCAPTEAVAQRMFIGSMGDSFPHRHQFNLFLVGEFDDDNGRLVPVDPKHVLAGTSVSMDLDPRAPILEKQS